MLLHIKNLVRENSPSGDAPDARADARSSKIANVANADTPNVEDRLEDR